MPEPRVVHVEISGKRYPIRTTLEAHYVQDLAAYVDRKIKVAAEASPSTDTVGLAVLAALNIADEFFRARDERYDEAHSIISRTEALERIVDEALQLTAPARDPLN